MFKKKKIIIHYNSKGRNGNVFVLLGEVRAEMLKKKRIYEYNDLCDKVNNAFSIDEAFAYINEKVELIDVSEIKNK